jgi:hypothetical protein
MLSLKLRPSGRETLMQIRVLFGWGTARMEFTLRFGRGGYVKGPATYFFVTQEAIGSDTAVPSSKDCF